MKKILEDLIKLVKEMKFGTDCGSEIHLEKCKPCGEYYTCKSTVEHRAKCDEMLKKLKQIKTTEKHYDLKTLQGKLECVKTLKREASKSQDFKAAAHFRDLEKHYLDLIDYVDLIEKTNT